MTISLMMNPSMSSSNIDDGYPFPIFSAAHGDSQDLAINSWSNSILSSHGRSDHFNEFETAVHRLGIFQRGVGDVNSRNTNSADNENVQWPHWRSSHLGFSSKFKGKLAHLVTEVKEGSEETANEVQGEKDVDRVTGETCINNQTRVEEFQEIVWRESHRETSQSAPKRGARAILEGSENDLQRGKQPSALNEKRIFANPPSATVPIWINLWFLFSTMVGIWDLWVMRAGTGEMLFEEIVLQKLEIVLSKLPIAVPFNHWLSDPIHQVFPHATEVALNAAYLFLTLAGWTPALLFAFCSVVLTLGQVHYIALHPSPLLSQFLIQSNSLVNHILELSFNIPGVFSLTSRVCDL
ncbi:hypothetical protein EV368DRAFT_82290 [Lentinula lateritia]|nr:hypothetical protein EV368DRAFT_82290 [Lentinula lateritia]